MNWSKSKRNFFTKDRQVGDKECRFVRTMQRRRLRHETKIKVKKGQEIDNQNIRTEGWESY